MSYTDLPIIRYAEVLLMYAEAKAELGTLTQQDVDDTINKLRERSWQHSSSRSGSFLHFFVCNRSTVFLLYSHHFLIPCFGQ